MYRRTINNVIEIIYNIIYYEYRFKHKSINVMRSLALILVIFLFSTSLFGQSLIDSTKSWNTIIQGPPYNPVPTIYTETIKIGPDTIIDLLTYKKVLRSTDEFLTTWNVYCFIRETIEKEVFFRSDTSSQEYLLYDFGAEEGDTLTVTGIESFMTNWSFVSNKMVVDSIDTVYFAGEYRKRINLSSRQWIEGIGCLTGILHNQFYVIGGDKFELVCYSKNDTIKYQNPTYNSCYYSSTGIIEVTESEKIILFPNPVTDKAILRIVEGNNEKKLVEIFDSKGVKIISEIINNDFEINRKDYRSGIYFYRVMNNKKLIGVGKFIIM